MQHIEEINEILHDIAKQCRASFEVVLKQAIEMGIFKVDISHDSNK
jgi:hypothetical protein